MQFTAKRKFLRMSPRKVRMVSEAIKGLDVSEAIDQLRLNDKNASDPIIKLLDSGIANAMHNNQVAKDNLFIRNIIVEQGPTMKRWMPRAFGRATMIRKRTSKIKVILEEKKESAKKTKKEKKEIAKPTVLKDYRSAPKGQVPDEKMHQDDSQAPEAGKTDEKREIVDKSKMVKRHDPDVSKGGKPQKQDKGFLKKIFKRKSV